MKLCLSANHYAKITISRTKTDRKEILIFCGQFHIIYSKYINKNFRTFQMKKKNKYNIAVLYEARKLENDTQNTSKTKNNHQNIFQASRLEKQNASLIQNYKKEQIVGYRQFINYKNKIKSGRKTRKKKIATVRTIRTDQIEKQDFHSKQAVFDSLPKINSSILFGPASQNSQSVMLTQIDNNLEHKKVSKYRYINPNSSNLPQIKENMMRHQNQWQKIFACEKENTKFPSINKSVQLYRSVIQKKEENELKNNGDMFKLRSIEWQMNLRFKAPAKQLIRSFHDEGKFTTRGKSKLKQEKQWLEIKDEKGYKFKFYTQNTEKTSNDVN